MQELNATGDAIPQLGDTLIYVSKIDNGPGNNVLSPAVVIRTKATCVEAVARRWGPEPTTVHSASDPSVTHQTTARPDGVADVLPDELTVDLLVHGLGKDYREYSVAIGEGGEQGVDVRGKWLWP